MKKIVIKGFIPEETIRSMPFESVRYCLFHNIMITHNSIFIPLDLDVYTSAEVVEYVYGEGCPVVKIERQIGDLYNVGFGYLFEDMGDFSIFPKDTDEVLQTLKQFLRIPNEYFVIEYLSEERYSLEEKLQKALDREDYRAAEFIKKKISKLKNRIGSKKTV